MAKKLVLLAVALGVAVLTALALSIGGPRVVIENARATPMGAGGAAAVTLDIASVGPSDRLLGAEARGARAILAGLDGGDHVPLPEGGRTALAVDGAHLMVSGLDGPLEPGRLVDVTLIFERAGDVAVKARVEPVDAPAGAAATAMAGMDHGAAFDVPEGEPRPSLTLEVSPAPDGAWRVVLRTDGFTFSQDAVDGPHQPGVGHAHLYVGGGKIGRLYAAETTIPRLPAGRHLVRATLNTNDHRSYAVDGQIVSATATIEAR